jgi:shikimate dehydrogenase
VGVARLALHDADGARREALAARLRAYGPVAPEVGSTDPSGFDLVINATPMGMREGDLLPVQTDRLAPGTFVGCVVTKPAVPPFIEAARARGLRTMTGAGMFEAVCERIVAFYLQTHE